MHPTLSRLQRGGLLKRSSYYNPDYRTGAALLRARRPYLVKNAITGLSLGAVAIGIFVYTLNAMGQEKFEDVIVPSGPVGSVQGAQGQGQALAIQSQNQATAVQAKIPTGNANGMRG